MKKMSREKKLLYLACLSLCQFLFLTKEQLFRLFWNRSTVKERWKISGYFINLAGWKYVPRPSENPTHVSAGVWDSRAFIGPLWITAFWKIKGRR